MPDNSSCRHERIEGFSYDLDMKTRKQNRKKQTNEKRAIWMVYRTDTNARGFWLVKRTLRREKSSFPKNFLEINRYFALTSYRDTIGQLINASSLLRFSLTGKWRGHCFIFSSMIKQITNTYRNHNQDHTKISPSGEVWTETAQNWNKSFTHFKHRIPERLAESFVH